MVQALYGPCTAEPSGSCYNKPTPDNISDMLPAPAGVELAHCHARHAISPTPLACCCCCLTLPPLLLPVYCPPEERRRKAEKKKQRAAAASAADADEDGGGSRYMDAADSESELEDDDF